MSLFSPEKFMESALKNLPKEIDGPAIIAVSGGVDSTVAAAAVAKAIGEDLLAVYVDTGYMRLNETEAIEEILRNLGLKYKIVDASTRFYEALSGVIDPEVKRKTIGELFIQVFEEIADEYGGDYLIQGTIAPDWIESGGGLRDTIKSHHNVGGLPEKMNMKIVEPLRDLYKDEVRTLARHLDLDVAERQPFPGPGLAVRVIGEATPERTEIVRQACHIAEDEIDKAVENGEMESPWQYFAVLLPVQTVGVQGDVRAYGNTVAVRAVQSFDAMTAQASEIPWAVQQRISRRITNTLKSEINRVVYDITDKPPGTIEWE
ncbi:MAG: GMP synthase [Marine Group III euryarchaeote CG-Bathy1]|uniref:GMP synthase [glutamine-hydrolyzing] subunit B n=1 Tax=Marine Group III euryarchaeote CG-Bathy1 TaxID=1889001 RepID=A0A1J5T0Z4_9ARCH|nr:MAG: GMP synthase [Marine Group III euryarchaeote CG-Bathy1]